MTGFQVAGIDPSLTSTGIARVAFEHCDGAAGLLPWPFTARVQSKASLVATLAARRARLDQLADQITEEAAHPDTVLVAVEGPSLGQQRQSGQHDRAGLWWLVVDRLSDIGVPVVEIPPSLRAIYATGVGNAAKDRVLAAAIKRYPTFDITGNDIADAVILAAIAARHLGHPIEDGHPKTHLRAMDKIRWPERTSA